MLTTLRIKNLALVTDLNLELEPGYNVITGETGAGKSVIIGALNLVLGERADRALIRSGTESCSVEAVLDIRSLRAPLEAFLEENGIEPCEEHLLILKRTFTAAGTNRQFVNGSATALSTLAHIGEWLVDMHGPHEHQSLLHPSKQLEILDDYGKLEKEREAFGESLERLAVLEGEKAGLIIDEQTYARQLDLLRYQVEEIGKARLQPGEDESISTEYHRVTNAARLVTLTQTALDILAESDASVFAQLGVIGRAVHELQRLDPSAAEGLALQEASLGSLRELQTFLSHYADKLEVDPARIGELEERLNLLQLLKKKYGGSLEAVQQFGREAQEQLTLLENREEQLRKIEAGIQEVRKQVLARGGTLRTRRRQLLAPLAKSICKHLEDLGFKQSRFEIQLKEHPAVGLESSSRISRSGLDTVEFLFSANPGEPSRPLAAIASSGELARVMLAIKTVLAADDRVPVLVFDEVDANVGGETANAVGEKMRQIAKERQVLCITHLPQVAAPASAHYLVSKHVRDGRTTSEIVRLEKQDRVKELARMLGGQSEVARKHAESLLGS